MRVAFFLSSTMRSSCSIMVCVSDTDTPQIELSSTAACGGVRVGRAECVNRMCRRRGARSRASVVMATGSLAACREGGRWDIPHQKRKQSDTMLALLILGILVPLPVATPTVINPWYVTPFDAGAPECPTSAYLDADGDGIPDPQDPCPRLGGDACSAPCPYFGTTGPWKKVSAAYHEVLRARPDDYNCMGDIALCYGGVAVPRCTSEDIRLFDLEVISREGECYRDPAGGVSGTLLVRLRARVRVTATERYDISIRIQALADGGGPHGLQHRAQRGKCHAFALPPDGRDQRDKPGENLEGCGENEFFQRDFDRAGDGTATFLDGESQPFDFFNETLAIPCQDLGDFSTGEFVPGTDGLADIGNCNSWSVSKTGAHSLAVNHEDLFPSQSSKCLCESVNLGVPIMDPPTSAPSTWPSQAPTSPPSRSPTSRPSASPTEPPSPSPTARPSESPVALPSESPTVPPSASPTEPPATPCGGCAGKVDLLLLDTLALPGELRFHSRFPGQRDLDLSATWEGDWVTLRPPPGETSLWTEAHVTSTSGLFDIAVHTSCSQPIGPGIDFCDRGYCVTVIEGTSVDGGALCAQRKRSSSWFRDARAWLGF